MNLVDVCMCNLKGDIKMIVEGINEVNVDVPLDHDCDDS